jgi:hypothetical protein
MAIHLVRVLSLQGIKKFVPDLFSRPFNGQLKMKSEDKETKSLAICIANEGTDNTVVKNIHKSNKCLHPRIASTLKAVREEDSNIKTVYK